MKKLCNHPSLVLTPEHPKYKQVMQNVKASGIELSDTRHSPKLMALKELLLDCGIGRDLTSSNNANEDVLTGSAVSPHRALIFCQMKQMLDIIENNLFKKQISVSYLHL